MRRSTCPLRTGLPSLNEIAATWPSMRDLTVTDAFASARPDALTRYGRSRRSTAATDTAAGGPSAGADDDTGAALRRLAVTRIAVSASTPATSGHFSFIEPYVVCCRRACDVGRVVLVLLSAQA